MNPNVQITAAKKDFKNGQSGYEVKVEGMDGKLDCKMNFHEPLKAMRYMFMLSKRLELKIDTIQLAALSLAYKRAKEAEQQVVDDAIAAANEVEDEQAPEDEPAAEEKAEESGAETSSLIKQFDDLKKKHPDALLIFRCGDFYESYREDAEACASILGITLTKRQKEGIAMAGFPYHALDTYLPKLIRAGKRVAICDQIEAAKPLVKRGITELVSPSETEPKRRGRKPKAEENPQELFGNESVA